MTVRTILVFLALCGGVSFAEAAADLTRVVTFDIPAQSVQSALFKFSEQTNVQVVVSSEAVVDKKSTLVAGELPVQEGLAMLLSGTDLQFTVINERTVAIRFPEKRASAGQAGLQLVQGDVAASASERGEGTQGADDESPRNANSQSLASSEVKDAQEIVVTGTHIRGIAPVGAPLIVIDREEIEASGHQRVGDLLETLPQNFGGASEDSFIESGVANQTLGQAINLRGVGPSSTLVLVNGRRQPSGGLQGSFVDISSIAASAVERIEILTDGASALYGADAIGGVVNFILRKDFEGAVTDVHLVSNDSTADELHASQLLGKGWTNGNVLFGYDYARRDALMQADRPFGALGWDYRSLGGTDYRGPYGSPGTLQVDSTTYAIPPSPSGGVIDPADLVADTSNYQDQVTGIEALPEYTQHSAFLTLSQNLSDRFELFTEARYSQRDARQAAGRYPTVFAVPASNPYYVNPTGGTDDVFVYYNFGADVGLSTADIDVDTYSVTVGGKAQLSAQWELNLAATQGQEKARWLALNNVSETRLAECLSNPPISPCPAPFNAFGDGGDNDPATINYIRDMEVGLSDYLIRSYSAIADGPVFRLPAGPARLAIGADYRDESVDATRTYVSTSTGIRTLVVGGGATGSVGDLDRQVRAVFGELVLPVLAGKGGAESPNGAGSLNLELAGRYEDYSDFGSTFDPKFGITFQPVEGLNLRGSWGTSFRAPRFNELSATANQGIVLGRSVADPLSSTGRSNVIQLIGADPNIGEETAEVWTAGFDLKLPTLPGFSLSASYFVLDYEDKILQGGDGSRTLLSENIWSSIITRNPTTAQIDAYCNAPGVRVINCGITDVAAIMDNRIRNLGGLQERGIDFDLGYVVPLTLGSLNMRLGGTRILDYEIAVSETAPFIDRLGTVNQPLDLRLRGSVGWQMAGWSLAGFVNYADGYRDPIDPVSPNRHVGSWTTVDVGLGYRFDTAGFLEGTRVRLNSINVLDNAPPFVNKAPGFDTANASDLGRSVSLAIEKTW